MSYVDIFDGVWNDGFIILDTGKIVSSTDASNPYKKSVYSNAINIQNGKKYIFGFLNNIQNPSDYRIRAYNVNGDYKGDLALSKYVTTVQDNRIFQSEEDLIIRMLYYTGLTSEQKTNFYFREETNMAIKSADQITIVDITDAYSVMLTSEAYTFVGGTNGVGSGQTCTTEAVAFCGTNACTKVEVNASNITCPTGISAKVDGSGTSRVKITFTTTATIATACEATIPVTVDGATVNKKFSFAVAKTGATGATGRSITGVTNYYLASAQNTGVDKDTAGWTTTMQTTDTTKKYLWSYQSVAYSSGNPTTTAPVIIGTHGATGGQGAQGTSITAVTNYYLVSTSQTGITTETAGWTTTMQTTDTTKKYLWSYQLITYSNKKTSKTTPAIIGTHGATGAKGEAGKDALTLTITASNGTVFKNSSGSTILTAHLFKGAVEQTIADNGTVANLGSIKWYKNGGTTAVSTSKSITVSADDVENTITYTCQLE